MDNSTSARVVAITGAGSGIGLAAATEYAKHGWKVGLIGRGVPALEDAARRVTEAGGTPHVAGDEAKPMTFTARPGTRWVHPPRVQ